MDSRLTLVELARLERERQSLVFGSPIEIIPCPHKRSLAAFMPEQIFGYERWRANNHGTVSWQYLVLRTGSSGRLHKVAGVHPAAEILFFARGKEATQRALKWTRSIRRKTGRSPQSLPENQWLRAANARLIRGPFPPIAGLTSEKSSL